MKKESMFFLEIIGILLIIILFAVSFEYKKEETLSNEGWNSGKITIEGKEFQIPIKVKDLEKKVGEIGISKTEIKSAYLPPNTKMKKKLIIVDKNIELELLLKNDSNEDMLIDDCEVVGIYLTDKVTLFDTITTKTTINKINKILKTGNLNPYYKKKDGHYVYEKDYGIKLEDSKKILYYYVEK